MVAGAVLQASHVSHSNVTLGHASRPRHGLGYGYLRLAEPRGIWLVVRAKIA
jgi:hypothetical protein